MSGFVSLTSATAATPSRELADDLETLALEEVRHGLDERGMVVRDEAAVLRGSLRGLSEVPAAVAARLRPREAQDGGARGRLGDLEPVAARSRSRRTR